MKKLFAISMLIGLSACGMNQTAVFIKDAVKTVQKSEQPMTPDAPMSADVKPVKKIANVARPKPATVNNCPPGAPILYRGDLTCPDRF
jgi:hypothetical protein